MDIKLIKSHLAAGEFRKLFIEGLGWDNQTKVLECVVQERRFRLEAVAEKCGFVAWLCRIPASEEFPNHQLRRQIENDVARTTFEHLTIFTDEAHSRQIWQWVMRETGKPVAFREHTYHKKQSGDSLIQKLGLLFVPFEEEGKVTLPIIASRVRKAMNVEKVTKKFYELFKKEHDAFLKLISGIDDLADREWYASLMLNRLMFVYFIQKKRFLGDDPDYLRNKLAEIKALKKKDAFYSFYRVFLLKLFHEGLGKREQERGKALLEQLGKVPYLNGGLFEMHKIEKENKEIQIPDKAFEKIFDYFDQYQWHLDERPTRADNEINPDVLGYIFEKYINQKQMGAYYTKEDITEYIGKSTIIPFLFDAARKQCSIAFDNAQGPTVWDLLRDDPDRYIYPAVRHGADLELPGEIARGLDTTHPDLIARRQAWNKPAPEEYALPTEIWREVVARRQRYQEIRQKLAAGEIREINDLITLNLDLRQFAQDVIQFCEGPDLLMAFWQAITAITILDPTGGSGAFLFAALNILDPLYEACLERMEGFIEEWGEQGEKRHQNYYQKFTEILTRVIDHPNRRYFVLKSIILNNLYAVDIMEEAVEICKLRLFLKLASQVEPDPARDNLGIEPLPDIDFNIRAGNSLVGYATYEEVQQAFTGALDFDNAMETITAKAVALQETFDTFRRLQTEGKGSFPAAEKAALQKQLKALEDELNRHLAKDYGVKVSDKAAYTKWLKSHQPFHWFIEFYGILKNGGFDVVIGNPPYVVNTLEKVPYNIKTELFTTYSSKNLYSYILERSLQLGCNHTAIGMIVQLTALSAEKMSSLQDLLLPRGLLVASAFPRRPESIFDGVEMPVTIIISRSESLALHTTRVNRFYTEERPSALSTMGFTGHNIRLHGHRIAKIGSSINISIYRKVESQKGFLGAQTSPASKHVLYYQEACRYWVKACIGLPFFRRNGELIAPPHGRTLNFRDAGSCAFANCLVNSTLFYWFYSAFSDCEHINDALIRDFRIPTESNPADWIALELRLRESQKCNARHKTILTKQGHKIEYDEMDASKSKLILDEIDTVLAKHYGFTEEELDFIINYDIKYRMGRGAEEDAE